MYIVYIHLVHIKQLCMSVMRPLHHGADDVASCLLRYCTDKVLAGVKCVHCVHSLSTQQAVMHVCDDTIASRGLTMLLRAYSDTVQTRH